VFEGSRAIEQPQSRAVSPDAVRSVALAAPAVRDTAGGRFRLYSLPITAGGRPVGAVVAAVSLAPYRQTQRTALIASVLLAVLAFVAVGLAANWLIRRALAPISRMTRLAAQWSEQDIDRRFAQGPPHDEFTELAFTLDGLMDRLASSLRHEQRLSAELSHELRTPLANVAAQAQYALRHAEPTDEGRQALENILASTQRMTTTLDTLIAAARAELDPRGATSDPVAVAQRAARACALAPGNEAVEIIVEPAPLAGRVAVEEHLLERILAPLLENACRHAGHEIRVRLEPYAAGVQVLVEDDGPGIAEHDLERIFEPGWQGDPRHGGATQVLGAGLGLALARRLARSAGGDVRADPSAGGARFVVELPRA
jgi:signal transduction histidine kinase